MAQNWLNGDNLFLQFGTDKAIAGTGGDYKSFGPNRVLEYRIDLTKLTSTATVQDYRTFIPTGTGIFIEKVELVVETASASGVSFSVGIIEDDNATIPSSGSTAFVNALINASTNTVGDLVTLTVGSTSVGGSVGTTITSVSGHSLLLSALSSGTYTTGVVKVRIFYHGIGTISQ
jgi:hypothetical protein